MSRKSSKKTVRKTAAEVSRATDAELDRLEALPAGAADAENPVWTDEQVASSSSARRRRVLEAGGRSKKQRITINIDEDLLAYFKALGEQGYQTRINEALRAYVAQHASAAGSTRALIERAKAALEEAERAMDRGDAA